jgi:MFS transporter, DHA3 family, macrolide efflux protein
MIIGGVIMAYWGGFKNKLHTTVLSYINIAICTFALGITNTFLIYLLFMVVVGVVMPMFNTPFTVLLQQKIEPELLYNNRKILKGGTSLKWKPPFLL